MTGGPLRVVSHYVWTGLIKDRDIVAHRDEFWDGRTQIIDGKSYIVRSEGVFADFPEPDIERLDCGHEQPVRTWGKNRKYYNLRRRCKQCALEACSV